MRVVILGTRGIPARYGGFETFAEELSVRLAERGHTVAVYSRHALGAAAPQPFSHRGVIVRSAPTIYHKYFETPLHALTSMLALRRADIDVVLLCNAANSPFSWLCRLRGLPVVTNVDGIERKRGKWNVLGKLWYRLGERCAVWFSNVIVADACVIADYYLETYGAAAEVVRYGAEERYRPPGETLARFGLTPGEYMLYVSRLEPENNALGVIQAYVSLAAPRMPLVIVGDAPYAEDYKRVLRRAANENVIFAGFQFGDAYRELRSHCYLYIQATEVGGTHPALVEAMAHGNCVVANTVPEHCEVLGDAGVYYRQNDFPHLAEQLRELLDNPNAVKRYGALARARASASFRWDTIVDQYEKLFERVCVRHS